jgi:hypothetical protein
MQVQSETERARAGGGERARRDPLGASGRVSLWREQAPVPHTPHSRARGPAHLATVPDMSRPDPARTPLAPTSQYIEAGSCAFTQRTASLLIVRARRRRRRRLGRPRRGCHPRLQRLARLAARAATRQGQGARPARAARAAVGPRRHERGRARPRALREHRLRRRRATAGTYDGGRRKGRIQVRASAIAVISSSR